ncbi:MAG: hypothetical protein ACIARR_11265 [Phycisphaerales bacterium JB059]
MKGGQNNEPIGGGSGETPGEETGAPVSEEVLLRARAEEAEGRCRAQEERIAALEAELEAAREALEASERRRQIDLALSDSDTVDLEVARLLTEAAVSQMDEPDVALAVEELRARKPFLFRSAPGGAGRPGPGMRPAEEGSPAGGLEGLAEEARRSGDRGRCCVTCVSAGVCEASGFGRG